MYFSAPKSCAEIQQGGGTVYELWGAAEPVNADELSGTLVNGPQANSNLTAYFVDPDGANTYSTIIWVICTSSGGMKEEWAESSNLTAFSGAPLAASDPSAYYDADAKTHHVVYATADGRVHELTRE